MPNASTIVVVEDQVEVRENLLETLELGGYTVYGAADGHQGVRLVREHLPNLVLCDVMMPKLDGYGVLGLLQSDPETSTIPFVFLTAKSEREDLRRGMNLGAADYVTKPFFQDELLRVVALRISQAASRKGVGASAELTHGLDRTRLLRALDELLATGRVRSFSDRMPIYFANDPPNTVYHVRSGRVRLFKETPFGKTLTIDTVAAGGWFGLADVLSESPHTLASAAYPEAELTLVDAAELHGFLRKHTADAYGWLATQFAQDLTLRGEQLVQIAYYSVRKRVAEFLLRSGNAGATKGSRIDLRREDIAESVASTPESVTRVLTEFRKEGLVELPSEGGIVLLGPTELAHVPA